MKFTRLVAVDETGLIAEAVEELAGFSTQPPIVHHDIPESEEEVLSRLEGAECALVSWNTRIGRRVIEACPDLKYIGMCCSLYDEASSNVDLAAARERGIEVTGIHGYGDEGLVEFVISELIQLCKGSGRFQWQDEPVELTGKHLGIIGLGATGRMLADRARGFGVNVNYFSRTRKPEAESSGINYLPLTEMLEVSDFVSLHLPRNTSLLGVKEFDDLGVGKVLINTSLGLVFDRTAFVDWVQHPSNFAIFDADGIGDRAEEFSGLPGVTIVRQVSGWTREARGRLSRKVLDNMIAYVSKLNR